MKLFIAEKPSLGKGIAQYLPGPHKTGAGCIECDGGKQVVTWAFGHIFEQAEPDIYTDDNIPLTPKGKKKWRMEDLPIFPEKWILHPKQEAKSQIKVIHDLLKKADSVVNAGDPDREGQLLVDEILDELGWTAQKKPTQRIWLAALDEQSVKKALANLKDNREYQNLKLSAQARGRADWLMGMNLTRAFTLQNKGSGVVSVGRVQTPTLNLVVQRDLLIEHFKPKNYFIPRIQTAKSGVSFWSVWQPSASDEEDEEGSGFDEEGRLCDKSFAEKLAASAKAAATATVLSYDSKEQKQSAPLGFSLSELQKACSAKFGISAQQVLDCAQALYEEHQATTYPRSDCRHLPEEQHGAAAGVMRGLSKLQAYDGFVKNAQPSLKSGIWNTGKITAHHAIIPTGNVSSRMTDMQSKVYDMIVRNYLAHFYAAYVYKASKIVLESAAGKNEKWAVSGQVPVSSGWKVVFQQSESF
jgi:DNA topoisomerase-3